MGYLALLSGLFISVVAIWYSIAGLTSIFAAAAIPIMVMGTALEVAKLVAASWLKQNWKVAPLSLKIYLTSATAVLMLITSMGIFGFLSKAHNDQNLVSGDVQSKISIYDEKIKTARENIEADRKQLKQMDEAVDQVMSRSSDEKGADKANAIRRSQQRDRSALAKDIEANQKQIASLNDEAAPIRAEVRKVEAEVGPIKYIAALIYGSNPDANVLEKAVTWVIILIVIVFDPLAVSLLLAAQFSFEQLKRKIKPEETPPFISEMFDPLAKIKAKFSKPTVLPEPLEEALIDEPLYEPDDDALTDEQIAQINRMVADTYAQSVEDDYVVVEPEPKDEESLADKLLQQGVTDSRPEDNMPLGEEYPFEPEVFLHPEGGEYVMIDGQNYHVNAVPSEFQKYVVKHTADSFIVEDQAGNATEHKLDDPTYIQNEEQQTGGLWQKVNNKISEEEYQKKSLERLRRNDLG